MSRRIPVRRAGLLAIAATALLSTACEATNTTTDVAVHCTIDNGDPLAGAPLPQPRVHSFKTTITPAKAKAGGKVWVDLKLSDPIGMFILGPSSSTWLELPIPTGLTLTAAATEDPKYARLWQFDWSDGSVLRANYAAASEDTSVPFIDMPRLRLKFTVGPNVSGDVPLRPYRLFGYDHRPPVPQESARCTPDNPSQTIAVVRVGP